MFDKRDDATQNNFQRFLKNVNGNYVNLYGYEADDAQVITTDQVLFKTLLLQEAQRKKERKEQGKDDFKITLLNTFHYGIPKDAELRKWWKNSIFAEQARRVDGFTDKALGGEVIFVATTNKERLKDFVQPIVDRHVGEFGISLDRGVSFYSNVDVPSLQINATVDNKNVECNDTFSTRIEMKNCAATVLNAIECSNINKTNGQGKE